MLKRTKSYLLFTLLVLTGFAGSIHSGSMSAKERRLLVSDLKETKKEFFKSIDDLSEAQLNFRPSSSTCSINDCILRLAAVGRKTWNETDKILKQPLEPGKRATVKITDEQVAVLAPNGIPEMAAIPVAARYKDPDSALDDFKSLESELVKFVRTSTDDMRNHIVQTTSGTIDAYQSLLLIVAYTRACTQQVEEIKADPRFPK